MGAEDAMGITTRTGDEGMTSLGSGPRLRKDSNRVEAYGTLDELSSFVAEARHAAKDGGTPRILLEIQADLARLAAELALVPAQRSLPMDAADVARLEGYIGKLETELSLEGFVVLGMTLASAKLDICRSIARRAERRLFALAVSESVGKNAGAYLNRLSDLLFLLARREEKLEGKLRYV
jgi:cob(I)alamin adenosyltransferase